MLGAVGYGFSLRTLRWVALFVAAATAVYLTVYGLTHPARQPGSLSDAFARGADTLSGALIHPLSMGHHVPVPGQIGWLVIVALLVLGYRGLEAWVVGRQAPCLDVSELISDRQDDATDEETKAQTGRQLHDWLVAELKFRLPAVEIRTPAIFPGGSRPSGLASIAEATGVNGAGLVGAVIRFFGMIWPPAPDSGPGLGGTDGAAGNRRLHLGHRGPRRPAVGCEYRHQDPGREEPRRCRCRGGRLRCPARLRPGSHRAAVERQRDRRLGPGGAAARPAGARLPGMPQGDPRRLAQPDRDPRRRGARQPVRRRRPVRVGATVRPHWQAC